MKIKEEKDKNQRTIKALLTHTKKVYFSLPTDESKKRFVAMAGAEGFVLQNGESAFTLQPESIMSVDNNGIVCFCGQAGHIIMAQENNKSDAILRVDFEKYINGDDDYRYKAKQ